MFSALAIGISSCSTVRSIRLNSICSPMKGDHPRSQRKNIWSDNRLMIDEPCSPKEQRAAGLRSSRRRDESQWRFAIASCNWSTRRRRSFPISTACVISKQMRNCRPEACFIESPIGKITRADLRIEWRRHNDDKDEARCTFVILLLAMMNAKLISGEPDNRDTIA